MTRDSMCLGLIASALAACGGHAPSVQLSSERALSGATSVGTAPAFALSPNGERAIAWVSAPGGGIDGRLYVAVGDSPPVEIRDTLGPIEAHGEAPPKIRYAPDGTLDAIYTVGKVIPGQRFPLSALRFVRSADGGKQWTPPVTITDGAEFGSHSFHALHVASNGTAFVSWLGSAPQSKSYASTSWIARSTDRGQTWSRPVRVDTGEACPCCRTALATSKDGVLYMAWRHVYPGNIRDIVVARSTDEGATWTEPVRVHADDWHFDGCPHAGPALAVDSSGVLHVAWWTGKEGAAGVFYTRSKDGMTFEPAIPLGVAKYSRPSHVQLAIGPAGRVVVVWDDGTRQVPSIVVRSSSNGGVHFEDAVAVSDEQRSGAFPVLGVANDSVAIAWSDESAATSQQEAADAEKMSASKAPMGLHPVGAARVLMRVGTFR